MALLSGSIILIHNVHAAGFLYINPSNVSQQAVGSTFTLQVQVAGMDNFTVWDIAVQSDASVIKPTNINTTSNFFHDNLSQTPLILQSCVNGQSLIPGKFCSGDAVGMAHIAGGITGTLAQPGPFNGLLFTITYNVTSNGGFSAVQIVKSDLSNGSLVLVAHSTGNAVYGTQVSSPDFSVNFNQTSLNVTQGSSVAVLISINSTNQFSGVVDLRMAGDFTGLFQIPRLSIMAGGSNSTTLTFSTSVSTAARDYPHIIVNATSGNLFHSKTIDLLVLGLPDFKLGANPDQLRLHAGTSGWTTIIVARGTPNFSGNVTLSVQAPKEVQASLSTSIVPVAQAGGGGSSNLTITIPLSDYPFHYLINVTGTSGMIAPHMLQIVIIPPKASFSINVDPGTVNIQAGKSGNANVTVTSLDYLTGFLYVSAILSGGSAKLSTTSLLLLPPIGQANLTLTITMDASTVPGNYVLLLTLYQVSMNNQVSLNKQLPVNIVLTAPLHSRAMTSTMSILGLSPSVYFGMLGVFALILVVLSVQTYRKNKEY